MAKTTNKTTAVAKTTKKAAASKTTKKAAASKTTKKAAASKTTKKVPIRKSETVNTCENQLEAQKDLNNSMTSKIKNLNSDIGELNEKIEELELCCEQGGESNEKLTELETQLEEASDDLKSLKNQLEKEKNKKPQNTRTKLAINKLERQIKSKEADIKDIKDQIKEIEKNSGNKRGYKGNGNKDKDSGKNKSSSNYYEEIKQFENLNVDFDTFIIDDLISTKKFIEDNLKETIKNAIDEIASGAKWNKDYYVQIDFLNSETLMQGNYPLVKIINNGKNNLKNNYSFRIAVEYDYNYNQQEKAVDAIMHESIPLSWRKDGPDTSIVDAKKWLEIQETKPLTYLLGQEDLAFKIFAEINAGTYWANFHRKSFSSYFSYVGTGLSAIPTEKNAINNLANLDKNIPITYYGQIYKIIERQLNESGISCRVDYLKSNTTEMHTMGNLPFRRYYLDSYYEYNPSYFDNNENGRHYYLQINFSVTLQRGYTRNYYGVIVFMSNELKLYNHNWSRF